MDAEFNRLPHIRTAFVITDGLGGKNRVGVSDHLAIRP